MNYRHKTLVVSVLFSLLTTMPIQVHGWWPWSSTGVSSGKNTSNTGTIVAVAGASFIAGAGTAYYLCRNLFKKQYAQKLINTVPKAKKIGPCKRPSCTKNAKLLSDPCIRSECFTAETQNSIHKKHVEILRSENAQMRYQVRVLGAALRVAAPLIDEDRLGSQLAAASCHNGGYCQKDGSSEFYDAEIPREDMNGRAFSFCGRSDSHSETFSQSSLSGRESNLSDFDNEVD